jgi:hypothetical protein
MLKVQRLCKQSPGIWVGRKEFALANQRHEYRGYRITIRRHGGGWRATIYAPNSTQPILGPHSDDPASHDDILDQAKRLIDALLSP